MENSNWQQDLIKDLIKDLNTPTSAHENYNNREAYEVARTALVDIKNLARWSEGNAGAGEIAREALEAIEMILKAK